MIILQQLSIRLTECIALHWQIWNQNKRDLLVREWVLLHPDHSVANPGRYNRHQDAITHGIEDTPVFIGDNLLTKNVPELGMIGDLGSVIRLRDWCRSFPVHLVQVLVALGILFQLGLIGLKRDNPEQGFIDVTVAGGIQIEVLGINHIYGRPILNDLIDFDGFNPSLHSVGGLIGLVVIIYRGLHI